MVYHVPVVGGWVSIRDVLLQVTVGKAGDQIWVPCQPSAERVGVSTLFHAVLERISMDAISSALGLVIEKGQIVAAIDAEIESATCGMYRIVRKGAGRVEGVEL